MSIPQIGTGFDVHAFDTAHSGRPLMLAGLEWPGEIPLSGHSDGDVVAHAVADALLSAAGLGDLGSVFGVDRPDMKNASGVFILAETAWLVRKAGYEIGNVAVQVVGNRPKVGPRRDEASAMLQLAIGAPVRLSATTSDGLGFTGRGEGIAAIANAIIVQQTVSAVVDSGRKHRLGNGGYRPEIGTLK